MNYVTQVFFILSILISFSVHAQFGSNQIEKNPIIMGESTFITNQISKGSEAQIKIDFILAKEHKAYLERFKLHHLENDKSIKVLDFVAQPIIYFNDPITKKTEEGVAGSAHLIANVKINDVQQSYQLEFGYQICTKKYCFLPEKQTITIQSPGTASPTNSDEVKKDSFEAKLEKSLLSAFLLVFLAGILTSFTPCVFPIIPLTLAVLGTRKEKSSHLQGFSLSLIYVLGIALMYSLLGLFAAATGSLFGSLLGHPIVISAIAFIFILMAFSIMGFYEIQVPHFISQKLQSTQTKGGYWGAFTMGLIAGVIAGPCVGPVLVSVLTYVAKTQNLVLGFFLLFTFAIGMGLLFIALGTFSSLSQKLPKSGPWMEGVKLVFGFAMIGLAIYYLAPLLEITSLLAIAAVIVLVTATLYFIKNKEHSPRIAKFLIVLAALFIIGSGGSILYSSMQPAQVTKHSHIPWITYSAQKMQELTSQQRPIILDFQAEWCAACKELEVFTFSHERIQTLAKRKNVAWVAFDATESSPEFDILKKQYSIIGLPTVIFIDSNGKWKKALTLTGMEDIEPFEKRLEAL